MSEPAVEPVEERHLPSLPEVERRHVELTKAEFREQSDKMIFEGRAAVFNEWTRIGGDQGFREQIKRGAFRKAIAGGGKTVLALNHNLDLAMASTEVREGPGMLELSEGTRGLDVYAELPPTQTARDTRTLVETGVIREMSFGWPRGTTEDDWNAKYDERTITGFSRLIDVSPVVFPAYAGTQASTRSLVDALAESFRADIPAEERVAAYRSILGTINPDSPLAAEIAGRALSQASVGPVAAAGLAEELEDEAQRLGRSNAAAVSSRLLSLRLMELSK